MFTLCWSTTPLYWQLPRRARSRKGSCMPCTTPEEPLLTMNLGTKISSSGTNSTFYCNVNKNYFSLVFFFPLFKMTHLQNPIAISVDRQKNSQIHFNEVFPCRRGGFVHWAAVIALHQWRKGVQPPLAAAGGWPWVGVTDQEKVAIFPFILWPSFFFFFFFFLRNFIFKNTLFEKLQY